jgi:hypothetical protein
MGKKKIKNPDKFKKIDDFFYMYSPKVKKKEIKETDPSKFHKGLDELRKALEEKERKRKEREKNREIRQLKNKSFIQSNDSFLKKTHIFIQDSKKEKGFNENN